MKTLNHKRNKFTPVDRVKNTGHIKNNKFLNAMGNVGTTQNNALAFKNSGSSLLDFYKFIGDSRYSFNNTDLKNKLKASLEEDVLLTLKILFWGRDIRGNSAGNRSVFRTALLTGLLNDYIDVNIGLIPYYGRWDDLFTLLAPCIPNTIKNETLEVIKYRLEYDINKYNAKEYSKISLLAKWLPRQTTKKYKNTYRLLVNYLFAGNKKEYRQVCSQLSKTVEQQMSANKWNEIEYSKLPSKAAMLYSNAFAKHDESRYNLYLRNLKSGKQKINVTSLEPYDVVKEFLSILPKYETELLEGIWENFDKKESPIGILPIIDTSGSMRSRNVQHIALAFGIYISERNPDLWKNKFFTFSRNPAFHELIGNSISEKVYNLSQAQWSMNTNIEKLFDHILSMANRHNLSNEDMPKSLLILSDGQYDEQKKNDITVYDNVKKKFEENGYKAPLLIEWNIAGTKYHNSNVLSHDKNIISITGFSKSIFNALLELNLESLIEKEVEITPFDAMMEILNSDRYAPIV